MMREAAMLVALGAVLSAVAAGVARVPPGHAPQILATLEAQVAVFRWDAGTARERLGDDLLLVDGRIRGPGARLPHAVYVPFDWQRRGAVAPPLEHQVRAALVVTEARRATEARALAQWVAREWGIEEVATLEGGFEAWQAAGLPIEQR
jgi:hypothetical protein